VTAPAALERARVHVVHEHATLVDDVDLVGRFVELEASLAHERVGILVVLFEVLVVRRRAMAEVPHQLAVLRVLLDAVLRPGARDPDEPLRVDDDGLQRRGPLLGLALFTPGVDDVAFLIELDQFRALDAAVEATVGAAGFVRIRGRRAIQEPDVIVTRIDPDAGDLLHAPFVRQPFRPERIDLEDRCAALVQRLRGLRLRMQRQAGKDDHQRHESKHACGFTHRSNPPDAR
jgi:hypothetical protein